MLVGVGGCVCACGDADGGRGDATGRRPCIFRMDSPETMRCPGIYVPQGGAGGDSEPRWMTTQSSTYTEIPP